MNLTSTQGYPAIQAQAQITTSGTKAALPAWTQPSATNEMPIGPAQQFCEKIILQADPGNSTDDVLIGDATHQVISLAAGVILVLDVRDPTTIYYKAGSNTPKLNVIYLGH